MAVSVVDGLELIQVDEERRHEFAPPARIKQGERETIMKQNAVGQPGERVMQRAMLKLVSECSMCGHVTGNTKDELNGTVRAKLRCQARFKPVRPVCPVDRKLGPAP